MNDLSLFDPLFAGPFATGLGFALLLPLLGCYLRLREEWLAALAFAQTAAAGSLAALLAGWPLLLGGVLAAFAAALAKHAFDGATRSAQGAAYALLLLLGWGGAVLLAANQPLAERMGQALFDGQLYFTESWHLIASLTFVPLALFVLRAQSRRLLLAHWFPEYFRARGLSARHAHLAFDLLVAAALALATLSVGVMAAFALIFVPPMIAFALAKSWARAIALSALGGLLAYLAAFALALRFDQPFGPVLAVLLVAMGVAGLLAEAAHRVGRNVSF